MKNRLAPSIVIGILVCSAAPATAQSDPEALYQAAVEAHKAGDSARAAALFRECWQLTGKPMLLYNEAIAWGDAGELMRAADAADEAAAAGLPADVSHKNAARFVAWNRGLNAAVVAAEIAARPATQSRVASKDKTAVPVSETGTATADSIGVSDSGSRVPRARTLGVVLVGVGAAGLATAGVAAWRVSHASDKLEGFANDNNRGGYDTTLANARILQTVGVASLIAGSAIALTGSFIWLGSASSERDVSATVGLGPLPSLHLQVRY